MQPNHQDPHNALLLSLVTPFYNKGEALHLFFAHVVPILELIDGTQFEIVRVNGDNTDDTLPKLVAVSYADLRVRVVDLIYNLGKKAVLTAGLDEALGGAVIPIDTDPQDLPELIPTLVTHWRKGVETVLAQHTNRACDSFLKRVTAAVYYRIHNRLSNLRLPENADDFRLMDRAVVDALKQLPEWHRFMKGLLARVGLSTVIMQYEREKRSTGTSKFSGWRLWDFALEGITSFSTLSLCSWTYLGALATALVFCHGAFITLRTMVFGMVTPGYASEPSLMLFFSGLQMIGLGMIDGYVDRIHDGVKGRPIYLVKRRYQERRPCARVPSINDRQVIPIVSARLR